MCKKSLCDNCLEKECRLTETDGVVFCDTLNDCGSLDVVSCAGFDPVPVYEYDELKEELETLKIFFD